MNNEKGVDDKWEQKHSGREVKTERMTETQQSCEDERMLLRRDQSADSIII